MLEPLSCTSRCCKTSSMSFFPLIFCFYNFTLALVVRHSISLFKALVHILGRAVLCRLEPLSCTSRCCKTRSMSSCSLDRSWSQSFRICLKLKKKIMCFRLICVNQIVQDFFHFFGHVLESMMEIWEIALKVNRKSTNHVWVAGVESLRSNQS